MKTCTFFGHKNAPQDLKIAIKEKISELIGEHGVVMFYVGNHGQFDSMVRSILKELKAVYPQIDYSVVLAYLPNKDEIIENSILPEGIELCYPKFAIDYRNRWMVEKSDCVITYVTHSWGGAAKYKKFAQNRGKTVYELNEIKKVNE